MLALMRSPVLHMYHHVAYNTGLGRLTSKKGVDMDCTLRRLVTWREDTIVPSITAQDGSENYQQTFR